MRAQLWNDSYHDVKTALGFSDNLRIILENTELRFSDSASLSK
jgi:hypothetical protein